MNHKLIKVAIAYPHAYPWSRENLLLDNYKLDELLENYNLDTEKKRRNAGWKIKFLILKEATLANSHEELLNNVLNNLENEEYCSKGIINFYIKRLGIEESENLILFKKLLNNELDKEEICTKLDLFIIWITNSFAYYSCINSEINSRDLQDKIVKYLNDIFNNNENYNEIVKSQIYKNGLIKNDVIKLFSKAIYEYREEIERVFDNLINKKVTNEGLGNVESSSNSNEDTKGNLSDNILSLFDNSTALILNESEINELEREDKSEVDSKVNDEDKCCENYTSIEKEVVEDITENNEDKVFNNLKALANTLGYQIASNEEVVLSKDKYNKLNESKQYKEITLLKEMALLKNGAILSELYNAYKNINDISKENLEAILTNFFITLSLNNFEAIEDKHKVGDVITVNTKQVLKEFIFTEATNKDGQVDVKVEYLGWKYKGKQIVPMAVKVLD